MKARAIVILIALVLSIFAPLSVAQSPAGSGTFLIALDVCDAANPAVSANSTMLGIHECPCIILPGGFVGFTRIADVMFHPLLIASQEEHPPRI
jgi:hypothetical protein